MRKVISTLATVAALALLMGSINPDEFECEEAVAHLDDCCGANSPVVSGITCGGTCSSVNIATDLAICLRKTSCATLRSSGVCHYSRPTELSCQ